MSDSWRSQDPAPRDVRGELPHGAEVFEAPHLFLLHTVLAYHRTLASTGWYPRVLIVRLSRVPYLDRRGARAVAVLAQLCRQRRALLVLSDVQPGAWQGLGREGVIDEVGPNNVFTRWPEALQRAKRYLGLN